MKNKGMVNNITEEEGDVFAEYNETRVENDAAGYQKLANFPIGRTMDSSANKKINSGRGRDECEIQQGPFGIEEKVG